MREKDETIWTESCHKYAVDEVSRLATKAGFDCTIYRPVTLDRFSEPILWSARFSKPASVHGLHIVKNTYTSPCLTEYGCFFESSDISKPSVFFQ